MVKKKLLLVAVISVFLVLGFLGMLLTTGFSQQTDYNNSNMSENKTLEELQEDRFDQKFGLFNGIVNWLKRSSS